MTAPRTPKEAVYDAQIAPLMEQIIALCKEHWINMIADFSLGLDPAAGETLFCTTALTSIDPSDENGAYRMTRAYRAMQANPGFSAFTITTSKR